MKIETISSIIEQLQFLRPEWFYAFIPLLMFVFIMLRRQHSSMSWKAVCDAQLLPYILTRAGGKTSRFPLLLVFIASALCIIATAGPVLEKLPQPVFREQSALVVLLDLSQSMDATDLKPTRLQRARLKLLDILDARKGGQTALVVYAADAFVVTPLTDDTNTIANLVPALETGLMPSQGSHAYRAIEKSLDLLKQAGVSSGNILLITDSIIERDLEAIDALQSRGHRLSILGIGTTDGSPIPAAGGFLQDASGAIVLPRLRPAELRQAALRGGGLYLNMTADDADIETFSKLFTANKMQAGLNEKRLGKTDLSADIWKEEGPWLLLLVIPLAALGLRRGWLLGMAVLLIMPVTEPAHALDLDNPGLDNPGFDNLSLDHLWSSPDQKAMRAFNKGDAATAAEQFEQPDWKSSAYYRAGEYEKAISTLEKPVSSDDFYNRGNALAQLGRYQEAIKAYDEALSLNEHNKDAAYNREQVKKRLQQQKNPQQDGEGQDQNKDQSKDQNNKTDDPDNTQNKADQQQGEPQENQQEASQQQETSQQQAQQDKNQSASDKENQAADPEQNKPDQSEIEQAMKQAHERDQQEAEKQQAEQETSEQKDKPETMSLSESENINEDDQATEQWLKRIPDNPGLLLQRKFLYQYKQLPDQTQSNEQW